LLAAAVQRLRKERNLPGAAMPPAFDLQINAANIELPIPVGIPAEYVPDKRTRLGLYRRMADLQSLPDLDMLAEEFVDRFGPLPDSTNNLFLQLKLKLIAQQAGLASITLENAQFALRFPDAIIPDDLPPLDGRVRVGKTALWIPYSGNSDWQQILMDTLERLQGSAVVALAPES
jgi:transcription-repair coupling factor (superfamily II helicase)